jgi:hypothetical protein
LDPFGVPMMNSCMYSKIQTANHNVPVRSTLYDISVIASQMATMVAAGQKPRLFQRVCRK